MSQVFNEQELAIVLQQLVEQPAIPTLYMRLVSFLSLPLYWLVRCDNTLAAELCLTLLFFHRLCCFPP
jgi:hypothetical protein